VGFYGYIADELESIRQKLLDLSYRNKLLNYKSSKRRTIPIIDESPREIYDIFVIQEKSMKFQPRGYDKGGILEESNAEIGNRRFNLESRRYR
jgi:hypothetical protein